MSDFWRAGSSEPQYAEHDVAEICLNGHVTTGSSKRNPEFRQKFCSKCGEATTTKCAACNTPIRGEYHVSGVIAVGWEFPAPAFCQGGGTAYPWTQARLMAARELAMELVALEPDEREALAKSLNDLGRDTPRTALAATRFKRLAAKAGSVAASGLKDILIPVVTETAKRYLWSGTS
jgi:hypothetical protein